jgi:hypothetical protein
MSNNKLFSILCCSIAICLLLTFECASMEIHIEKLLILGVYGVVGITLGWVSNIGRQYDNN